MPSSSTTRILTDVVGVGTRSPQAPLHNVGKSILEDVLKGPVSILPVIMSVETCIAIVPTGVYYYFDPPVDFDIVGWTLHANVASTVSIDLWVDDWFSLPATAADSICASAKPTLTAATDNRGFDRNLVTWKRRLRGWTDSMAVNLEANDNASLIVLNLYLRHEFD